MLAAFAFSATGLLMIAFGFSSKNFAGKDDFSKSYWMSYVLLGLAFIGYGIGAIVDDQSVLNMTVLSGNFFIALSSLTLLGTYFKLPATISMGAGALISATLVLARNAWFEPEPELVDGILYFNTQTAVGVLIGLLFVIVWLPANIKYARILAEQIKMAEAYNIYSGLFILATLSAVIFLASRSAEAVIMSFATITISFCALMALNYFAKQLVAKDGK